MSDEIVIPVEEQKRDNSTLIIIILAIVIIFFCCCCLVFLLAGWFVGDYVIDWFRFVSNGVGMLFV
jgi:hypothetical protein